MELKAKHVVDVYDDYSEHPCEESSQVYLKYEADKVIALLTDKANYNEYAYKHKSEEFADTCRFYEDELRHQKYKRCLAMAQEWRNYAAFCGMQSHCHNHRGFGKTADKWTWKECHAWRCVKRWLELAEKFKEAK